MERGVKDTLVTLFSRLAAILPTFLIQISLARLLGTHGRGEYALLMSCCGTVAMFGTLGVSAAGRYYLASGKIELSSAISGSLMLLSAFVLLTGTAAVAILHIYPTYFQASSAELVTIAFFMGSVVAIQNALLLYLTAVRAFNFKGGVNIAIGVVQLLAVWAFVGLAQGGAIGAFAARVMVVSLAALAVVLFLRSHFQFRFVLPKRAELLKILSYGSRALPHGISYAIFLHASVLIMQYFVSESQIGLYSAALSLSANISLVSDTIAHVIHVRIASSSDGRTELVGFIFRVVLVLSSLVMVVFLLWSEFIVVSLLGHEFLASAKLLWILTPGFLMESLNRIIYTYFVATNRPGLMGLLGVARAVGLIVALYLLLETRGIEGAALALTISIFLYFILLQIAYVKVTEASIIDIWLPRENDFYLLYRQFLSVFRKFKSGSKRDDTSSSRTP